jgi:hypothetical protein
MFLVRYELGSYTPEDGILYSHRRENLRSYIGLKLTASEITSSCHLFRDNFIIFPF